MSFPLGTHSYLVGALENGPIVLDMVLKDFSASDPFWDFRPNPERFSLREMVAHIADWNDIYRERIERTRDESNPQLPNCDEGQIAMERDYAHSDPVENLRRYRETRKPLIDVVNGLTESDWDRIGTRQSLGEMTLGEQIALCSAHDAYHIRQAVEYCDQWRLSAAMR